MSSNSKIEWTETTWNPVVGCTKVGAGCDNCYAERMANRMFHNPKSKYNMPDFGVQLFYERLDQPILWRRPRMIFVNSMSDLFHKEIPDSFIDRVFDTMELANHHTYQILTKRSSRMRDYVNRRYEKPRAINSTRAGEKPHHIWFGVSVENEAVSGRIHHLKGITHANRFVSFEPLLGDVRCVILDDIHWVIVGGESGPGARPMEKLWVEQIRYACASAFKTERDLDDPNYGKLTRPERAKEQPCAFFFKQWGAYGEDGIKRPKHENGRLLGGVEYSEYPDGMVRGKAPAFSK